MPQPEGIQYTDRSDSKEVAVQAHAGAWGRTVLSRELRLPREGCEMPQMSDWWSVFGRAGGRQGGGE
ncbi:hypothetical protein GCM10022402_46670 [Salinactinospora qingdaonensis]|uniref:Uncharacterized protein n=1 Tax=Salinactinospora qingdaonensis TaxID=702744 RepID=A0ABP7GJE6_9ACTN